MVLGNYFVTLFYGSRVFLDRALDLAANFYIQHVMGACNSFRLINNVSLRNFRGKKR